jgi:thiamine-monophosphate kinase
VHRVPSESELIEAFVRASGAAPRPPLGPGDDASVLPAQGPSCVTVDALLEGVHFRRSTFSLPDVGAKALAVNLSDLAAMGARPRWCLVALGIPRGFGLTEAKSLGRGLGSLARGNGVAVLGGNVTRAPGLSLTVTVGGDAPPAGPLLRSGARAGDEVWVSGTLGDARLGLACLERPRDAAARRLGAHPGLARAAVRRQQRPTARVSLGRALTPIATACIDLSDGLAQDASHLARASGVRLRITLEHLPLSRALRLAIAGADRAAQFAAAGGEDYELLFTARPSAARRVRSAGRRTATPVTAIGRVVRGHGVLLFDSIGRAVSGLEGFDHLA